MSQSKPTDYYFKLQLERILASLRPTATHALGHKKPSMGQQESSEK